MPLRPDDVLGAHVASVLEPTYEIDAEIGRGGMGIVYCAKDSRLKRNVSHRHSLALSSRGGDRCAAEPPQHRPDLQRRREGQPRLFHHGVHRGRQPRDALGDDRADPGPFGEEDGYIADGIHDVL